MVEAVDLHCKQPIWLAPHRSSLPLPLLQPLWQPYLQHNGHYLEVSGMSKPVLPAISLCFPSHPLTFAYCLYIHCVRMYVCTYTTPSEDGIQLSKFICVPVYLFAPTSTSSVCLCIHLSVCPTPPPVQLSFTYSTMLWPWSGYLAVSLTVTKNAMTYSGEAKGHVLVTVSSPSVSKGAELNQSERGIVCSVMKQIVVVTLVWSHVIIMFRLKM